MKRMTLVVLMIGIMLVLSGCITGNYIKSTSSEGQVEAPQKVSYEKSDSIAADIYLDGTTSMYGYVNYPGGTIYVDAVKNIERTITENWKNDSINYIKFGDSFQKITRDTFLHMDKTAFYDQKDTSLQKIVEQANDSDLTIIITDLFQTNQDLDSLVNSLKNKGLNNGKAIAIVGIKSQFNGKIFDIGKSMSTLDYASTDDATTYRPFYVVVIGNENDTRYFVKSYMKKLPQNAQPTVAFLAHNLGIQTSLETDKVTNKKKNSKDNAAKMASISNIISNKDILQYRLKVDEKISETPVRLYAKDVLGKIPETYSLKIESVEFWNQNNFEKESATDFLNIDLGEAGLKDTTANISFMLQAKPSAIHKKEGIHRANLSLIPDKESYIKAMDVFSDWNFDDSQINENPDAMQKVGNKTLNINRFISMLAGMNYELNTPGFHNLYVYFDVK